MIAQPLNPNPWVVQSDLTKPVTYRNPIISGFYPDPSVCPDEDRIEKYWLTYYTNIFNPARIKKSAMLSSMPKKYWKNMPETALIDDMIRNSDARARKMITDGNKR